MGGVVLILVGCLCDWSLETFCFSTCLIFIVFSRALSAVQYENCTILPLGPLDADPDLLHPEALDEMMCVADKVDGFPALDISFFDVLS